MVGFQMYFIASVDNMLLWIRWGCERRIGNDSKPSGLSNCKKMKLPFTEMNKMEVYDLG